MLGVDKPYHYPVPRPVKNFRLKEWQAFQFGDRRWFFFCAIYNAKFLTLIEFQAYDRESKQRFVARRMLPGGGIRLPDTLAGSSVRYSDKRFRLAFSSTINQDDDGRQSGTLGIEIAVPDRRGVPGFEGSFSLGFDSDADTPNVVCLPLGLNRAMYSAKALLPMNGWFRTGMARSGVVDSGMGEPTGSKTEFSDPQALGIFDDHKGYYPWRMRYDWVSGFGVDASGRRVGFNLTDNQVRDQSKFNENCVWIDGELWPLPPVKVTRPNGPAGEWIIQDTEGLVDLVFIPEVQNDIRIRAIIVEADYHGPFGSFKGEIGNGAGSRVDASVFYGMGEQKYLQV